MNWQQQLLLRGYISTAFEKEITIQKKRYIIKQNVWIFVIPTIASNYYVTMKITYLFCVLFIVQLCILSLASPMFGKSKNPFPKKFKQAPEGLSLADQAAFHAKEQIKHEKKAGQRFRLNKQAHRDAAKMHGEVATEAASHVNVGFYSGSTADS